MGPPAPSTADSRESKSNGEKAVKEFLKWVDDRLRELDRRLVETFCGEFTSSHATNSPSPSEFWKQAVNDLANPELDAPGLEERLRSVGLLRVGVPNFAAPGTIERHQSNKVRVTFDCENQRFHLIDQDEVVTTAINDYQALKHLAERYHLQEAFEVAEAAFKGPRGISEYLANKIKETTLSEAETSKLADAPNPSIDQIKSNNATYFERGYSDEPYGRAERVAPLSGRNRCDLPDFEGTGTMLK